MLDLTTAYPVHRFSDRIRKRGRPRKCPFLLEVWNTKRRKARTGRPSWLATDAVRDILEMIAAGERYKDIAEAYGVSPPTVRNIKNDVVFRDVVDRAQRELLAATNCEDLRKRRNPKVHEPRVKRYVSKLDVQMVEAILDRLEQRQTCHEIGKDYGVSSGAVASIKYNETWRHVGDPARRIAIAKLSARAGRNSKRGNRQQKSATVEVRFLDKISCQPNGCWEWTGHRSKRGHGRFRATNGGIDNAHRVSYELFVGPIPADTVVRHKCDNRGCVNPEHLTLGTCKQNNNDIQERIRINKLCERFGIGIDDVVSIVERYFAP